MQWSLQHHWQICGDIQINFATMIKKIQPYTNLQHLKAINSYMQIAASKYNFTTSTACTNLIDRWATLASTQRQVCNTNERFKNDIL